jgi:hypothetical protein
LSTKKQYVDCFELNIQTGFKPVLEVKDKGKTHRKELNNRIKRGVQMATTNEIANMTFKAAPGKDFSAVKGDLQMFNIITAMDGLRSVGTVAEQDFYDLEVLAVKVSQLVEMGLLVPVQGAGGGARIGGGVMDAMQSELTKLVGPVAGMLLKDCAKKLGHDLADFPLGKANELLDMVGRYIQDPAKADEFENRILARMT